MALLLAAVLMAAPARAEFELIVDGSDIIRVRGVESNGEYLSIVVSGAVERPLRLPYERIACGKDCPPEVSQRIAQAKRASAAQAASASAGPGQTLFQIHGSNTIGQTLMPALVEAFLTHKFGTQPLRGQGAKENETLIEFDRPGAERGRIEVQAHGSNEGFQALFDNKAQIWMSSRPARDKEGPNQANEVALVKLKGRGDLTGPGSEHVVAMDGLAVIVNRENPVSALQLSEIAGIFSGKIRNWKEVGGRNAPIVLYRRDDKSGTTDTFKSLVLNPLKASFGSTSKAFESSQDLETEVSRDANGIGFVGYGYVLDSKKLAIRTSCGLALAPDPFVIKTEEYPLARRLFLYTIGTPAVDLARELIEFTATPEGQSEVKAQNFIDLGLEERDFEHQGGRLAYMLMTDNKDPDATKQFLETVRFARRLSLTFRFRGGDNALDTRALADVTRLARELKSDRFRDREFLIIGFSDDKDDARKALSVSAERALAVKEALEREGVPVYKENLRAFGLAAPVACNDGDRGNRLNRRVEVWIR